MASEIDKKNDEVDLLDLFQRMGKTISGWFGKIFKAIIVTIVFLLRNWIPIGLSIIISVALTFIAKKTFTAYYKSEMTIRSNTVPNPDMITYINRLHSYFLGNNKNEISELLSLSPEEVSEIDDIEAFWVIDQNRDNIPDYIDYKNDHDVYDTLNVRMDDRIAIRARITSLQYLPALRDGLFRYITDNQLFRQQNDLRLSQLDELQTRISYDIKQLDSLQKVKYFEETRNRTPDKSSQMIFLQPQNTQLLYEDIYSLYNRRQQIELEKNIDDELITMISDFTIPARPYTGLKYYGKIIIPTVVGLTLLLLVFYENRKRIRGYLFSQTE
jgi:hypothetical protein